MAFRIEPHAQPIPGYRLMERLGSGGFGEVWKTEAPGGIFKAIKFIHGDLRTRDNDLVRYAEQELKALNRVKTVRHPYLLSLDRIDIVDGRLMIIMELADCNLWDRFRHYRQSGQNGIPREELLRYFIESAEVLDLMNDMHSLQHLDIKPQNLFLLHHHVKVADFGQVKDLQGAAAEVTGGITPVYAAPETFEGYVSKFCDQYSLACVYQELLTGIRPFDGTSLQQLLVQHVEQKPNLNPSPLEDRASIARALEKKPENRFPTCMAFVQSLIRKAIPAIPVTRHKAANVAVPVGVANEDNDQLSGRIEVDLPEQSEVYQPSGAIAVELTGTPISHADTPFPNRSEPEQPSRLAPPEETGPGSLRPTVVIGLGGWGQRILRRFRKLTAERFGNPDRLPLIRTLYIDSDPTDLDLSTAELNHEGLPGLAPDTIFPARLYRAGHYLKPRLSGKSLIEGWFDSQLLYKIGRVPTTGGNRSFGRLAFCDSFRGLTSRIHTELATALDPLAYEMTRSRTNLTLASNRPRVYLVGGLAGGTAGGMFLDLAYTVRAQLKFLGYSDPDLVGMFLLPPDNPDTDAVAQSNVYAALTELNHYHRTESIFTANYDDRNGQVRDGGKPFKHVYLLPSPNLTPQAVVPPGSKIQPQPQNRSGVQGLSGFIRHRTGMAARPGGTPQPARPAELTDKSVTAAELQRLDLFTPVGRTLENQRKTEQSEGPPVIRTAGVSKFYWARGEVVNRTAVNLSRVVLINWVSVDVKRAREIIPTWTSEAWTRMGLDPDPLIAGLAEAASTAIGGPVEQILESQCAPLQPRGWLSRGPDSGVVVSVLTQLQGFLGHPVTSAVPSPLEEAICPIAVQIVERATAQMNESLPKLCDDTTLRLSGTEEAANQFVSAIDRLVERFEPQANQLDFTARSSFEKLMAGGTPNRGRKIPAQEMYDAAKQFATSRFQVVIFREVITIYKHLRVVLTKFLSEASSCRQRLELELQKLLANAEITPAPKNARELLPPNCPTTAAAVEAYTQSLTDEDLHLLERRVQSAVIDQFDGLFNACLNTTDGINKLLALLQDEARAYLDARLTDVDLVPMLASQYRTQDAARSALMAAFRDAEPTLAGPGPWAKQEITIVATPAQGNARSLAFSAIDTSEAIPADIRDEIAYIRELPTVPLAAIPQLGPAWEAAYKAACEIPQGNPHCRGDVAKWVTIDAS